MNLEVEVTLGNNVNPEKDVNRKCVVNLVVEENQDWLVNQSYWLTQEISVNRIRELKTSGQSEPK